MLKASTFAKSTHSTCQIIRTLTNSLSWACRKPLTARSRCWTSSWERTMTGSKKNCFERKSCTTISKWRRSRKTSSGLCATSKSYISQSATCESEKRPSFSQRKQNKQKVHSHSKTSSNQCSTWLITWTSRRLVATGGTNSSSTAGSWRKVISVVAHECRLICRNRSILCRTPALLQVCSRWRSRHSTAWSRVSAAGQAL